MTVKLCDQIQLKDGVRRTPDGYLTTVAAVARANVQAYDASIFNEPPSTADGLVRLYRPESEVFHKDSLNSVAHKPFTNDHPAEDVSSSTWRDVAIGQLGGDVARDGESVTVPMTMMDEGAIQDWENGKRELSAGYRCNIDWTPGTTPDGQLYDGIQRDIRFNHVALVRAGRAGQTVRFGDSSRAPSNANSQAAQRGLDMTTRLIDGISIETSEQGAQAIDKLQQQVADTRSKLEQTQTDHEQAIETKDKELADKDAEIEKLKAQVLSDEALDEKVRKRSELIADAKAVADLDYTGCSEAQIRRKAVSHHLGDEAIKDKSDAYVEGRYASLRDTVEQEQEREQQDPFLQSQVSAHDAANVDPITALHERQAKKLEG